MLHYTEEQQKGVYVMKTTAENIGAQAAAVMRRGLHCSEAILGLFNERLGLGLDARALKMASGFAGGIGCGRDVCGALTGAVMVIGALYGRAEPGVDDSKCQALANRLREDFLRELGSSSCEVLAREVWRTPQHLELCADRITAYAAAALQRILDEDEERGTAVS